VARQKHQQFVVVRLRVDEDLVIAVGVEILGLPAGQRAWRRRAGADDGLLRRTRQPVRSEAAATERNETTQ